MLFKLLQHLLIWLAASAVIVLGAGWGYAVGYTSHRPAARMLAWTIATVTVIFAAALVQRAPVSIVLLVLLSAVVTILGGWIALHGAQAGIVYLALGMLYLVTLGPEAMRWLTTQRR